MPSWIGGLSPRLVGWGIESMPSLFGGLTSWIGGLNPCLVCLGD